MFDRPGLRSSATLAELARRLNLRNRKITGRRLPATILMTDAVRLPDPTNAIAGLPPGSAVIFRHYQAAERATLAAELANCCRTCGLSFLVAGDGQLALRVGAAGLHLPERQIATAAVWRRRRPDWLITVAAHSLTALKRATAADAALLSPVFATASHPGARVLGPGRFTSLARCAPVPVYALGGVNAETAHALRFSPAIGLAAIDGLVTAGGSADL